MEEAISNEANEQLEDEINALFKLPLAEFIGSRNELAAKLKRGDRSGDASVVKALAKPTVSSWAVNQLYWNHREAFDHLLVTSQRFRQSQTAPAAGAGIRESLEERRQAIAQLSNLATVLLRDAGHNPTLDTIHRVTTNLEAISAFAPTSDGPTPGRLTEDIQPPGFDSLASFVSGIDATKLSGALPKVTPSKEARSADSKPAQKPSPPVDTQDDRQDEEAHRTKVAAARLSVKEAKRALTDAQSKEQRLVAQQRKAHAEAKEADAAARQAEKQLRQAEERFKKASAASENAAHCAQQITAETEQAARVVKDAERTLEEASKKLASLFAETHSV
jgi:DNA repair exonuclease SbcCD ATPase subunit